MPNKGTADASKHYFTYESRPCVDLTYFAEGQTLNVGSQKQCGNPVRPIGMPTCCRSTDTDAVVSNYTGECLFGNERTTWATAKGRCEALNQVLCDERYRGWASWQRTCADGQPMWNNRPCKVQAQVLPSGQIMLVDPLTNSNFRTLYKSNGNAFRVQWDGQYPVAFASRRRWP